MFSALIANLLDLYDPIVPEDVEADEKFGLDLKNGRGSGRMVTPSMLTRSKRRALPKGSGRAPFSRYSVKAVRLTEEPVDGRRFEDPFEYAVAEEARQNEEKTNEAEVAEVREWARDRWEVKIRLARFNIEIKPRTGETNQDLRDLLQAVRNRVPTYIDVDGEQRLVEVFPACYFRAKAKK